MRGTRFAGSLVGLLWVLTVPLYPQSLPPGDQNTLDRADTVIVDVDVVNVYFNVWARDQLVEQQLSPQEFQVFEDDRPQRIKYFSSESQQPLTLAVMVDSSTSQKNVLGKQLEVGTQFLLQILRKEDHALVLGFDSRVQLQQDFTGDPEKLTAALAGALQGTTGSTDLLDPGHMPRARSTALYDAIVGVANERMRARTGHKAMVILTDGQDMGSRRTALEAIEAAERSDTSAMSF